MELSHLVLVITRDGAARGALQALIESAGCTALFVPSVPEAIGRLRHVRPLLIFIDSELAVGLADELDAACEIVEIPAHARCGFSDDTLRWLAELVEHERRTHA